MIIGYSYVTVVTTTPSVSVDGKYFTSQIVYRFSYDVFSNSVNSYMYFVLKSLLAHRVMMTFGPTPHIVIG